MVAFAAAERLLDAACPHPADALSRFGTSVVFESAEGAWIRVAPTDLGERCLPVPLEAVSPHVVEALIASEDRRFFSHSGVDVTAVGRAVATAIGGGRIVSGASTLTMQLARIAEPRPRTLRNKMREAIRARQIERRLGKREILEAYLNGVPWGGTLRGVEAASRTWFGKRALDLAPEEAAALVAMLPAPSRRAPDRAPGELRFHRDRILDRMAETGVLSEGEHLRARSAPLRARRRAWPYRAPHACDLFALSATGPVVRTTIRMPVQDRVEAVLRGAEGGGVDGAAAVVVERGSGRIVAMVGSRDYRRAPLNAAVARRSAGSTLKPFLYALAVEECVVGMDGLVLDTEGRFGEFHPSNFDDEYRGRVVAADALADSRNLPAVRLLQAIGADRFRDLLTGLGLRVPDEAIDLDAALGTIAVSPLELARAYARFFSDGGAVLGALARRQPAEALPEGRIAWKTGTSSGRRDAWSVGITPEHVVVVWLGNLDGRAHPNLVGSRDASEIMAAVVEAVAPFDR